MMENRILYILIVVLFFIVSCNKQKSLTPAEYISWVNENEYLIKEQKLEPYIYSVRLIPYEFNIAKDIEKNVLEKAQIDSLKKVYSPFVNFIFKISCNDNATSPLKYNVVSNEEFSNRLQYCSFNIQEDFRLIHNKDTVFCTNAHFIQEYDLRPYNIIILSFEMDYEKLLLSKEDLILVYEDYLWGNGIIKFKYNKPDLECIPNLKY